MVATSDGLSPLSVTAGVVLVAGVGEEEPPQAPINSPARTAKDTDTKRLTLMLDSMLTGIFLLFFDDGGFLFGCPGSVIHRGPPQAGRFQDDSQHHPPYFVTATCRSSGEVRDWTRSTVTLSLPPLSSARSTRRAAASSSGDWVSMTSWMAA